MSFCSISFILTDVTIKDTSNQVKDLWHLSVLISADQKSINTSWDSFIAVAVLCFEAEATYSLANILFIFCCNNIVRHK